jgi:hypothetical protein
MTNEELYLKSRITNENPFRVPEGYFDRLTADVMARLPERQSENPKEEKTARRIQLRRSWLAAASVAVVAIVGTLVYFNKLNPADTADKQVAAVAAPVSDSYIDEAADYLMIDHQDIYACLTSEY